MMKKYAITTTIRPEHAEFLREEDRKVSDVLEDAIDRLIKLKQNVGEDEPTAEQMKRTVQLLNKKIQDMNLTIEEFIVKGVKKNEGNN